MGVSKRYTTGTNEEAPKVVEGIVHDNKSESVGTFLQTK